MKKEKNTEVHIRLDKKFQKFDSKIQGYNLLDAIAKEIYGSVHGGMELPFTILKKIHGNILKTIRKILLV